jgi:hypothetical protein
MFLNDEKYEDEHGRWVPRSDIECLGTYQAISDGFFKWCCGSCGNEGASRGLKIGGTVWKCSSCGKKNLLVRTDIRFVNQHIIRATKNNDSAEEAITRALEYFGRGIAELGRRH